MPNPSMQINGIFISFTEEEIGIVNEGLRDFGYSEDVAGLKKWILDQLTGEEIPVKEPIETATDRVLERLGEYLIHNPESIGKATHYAGQFASGIWRNVKKATRK